MAQPQIDHGPPGGPKYQADRIRPANNPIGQRLADPQVLPRGRILHVQDVCLFGLQVDLACQIAILLGFPGDELGELLRRAAKRHDVQPLPAFQQRWRLQRFDEKRDEVFPRRLAAYRAAPSAQTSYCPRNPADRFRSSSAGPGIESRRLSESTARALSFRADEIDHGLGTERILNLVLGKIRDHRAAAPVGHVDGVDTGGNIEPQPDQVRLRVVSARTVG